jgi:RNA polymerase sigma-B factor
MTAAASALWRTQAATSPEGSPGRRQARASAAVTVPASDIHVLGADTAPPDELLARLHEFAPGDAGRVAARTKVINWYLPMSVSLARRFGRRGEPLADLIQVAVIGLIKAVDRYDAARGVPFASYAIPTMTGEIKRYFRDAGWTVRVPRRMQELGPQVSGAVEDLAHALHRSPTTQELATRLGVSCRQVSEARACAHAYRPLSFEQPAPGAPHLRLVDVLVRADPGLDAVDRRETLRRALAVLPMREQRIIDLRFGGEMTQAQIAAQIGVSQMHISRLLTRSLIKLRDTMQGGGVDATSSAGGVRGAGPSGGRSASGRRPAP